MVNLLIRYQKVRFSNIQRLIGNLAQTMDAEVLHTLRVELKRVRFLKSILVQDEKKQKIDSAYKPFKKLFKQVGKIRGQQVNLYRLSKALKQNDEPKARKHFKSKQEELEQQLRQTFVQHANRLSQGMLAMETMLKQLSEQSQKSFLIAIQKQVAKNMTTKTPAKKLHSGRHVLKSVIYSAELSRGMTSKINSIFNIEIILDLEDAIGDWHDFTILLKGKAAKLLSAKARKEVRKKMKIEKKRIYKLIPQVFMSSKTTP